MKFVMEHFYYVPGSKLEFDFNMNGMIKFEEHIADCDRSKSRVTV